jgi:hypothetical protein
MVNASETGGTSGNSANGNAGSGMSELANSPIVIGQHEWQWQRNRHVHHNGSNGGAAASFGKPGRGERSRARHLRGLPDRPARLVRHQPLPAAEARRRRAYGLILIGQLEEKRAVLVSAARFAFTTGGNQPADNSSQTWRT